MSRKGLKGRFEVVKGSRVGSWTVICDPVARIVETKSARGKVSVRFVNVECDCGEQKEMRVTDFRVGKSRRCMKCKARSQEGMPAWNAGTREVPVYIYDAWAGMMSRCFNVSDKGYKNYGARGIRVYSDWIESPAGLFQHIGPRPSRNHSIDRVDNDGDYAPGNLRWATRPQQNRNRRDNKHIEWGGRSMCVTDWERETGLSVARRLYRGWSVEEALTLPEGTRVQRVRKG